MIKMGVAYDVLICMALYLGAWFYFICVAWKEEKNELEEERRKASRRKKARSSARRSARQ